LTIIASLILYITSDFSDDSNPAQSGPVHNSTISRMIVIVIMVVSISFFLLVVILLGFHLYLILRGKTTKEELTKKKKNKKTHKCYSWLIVKDPSFKGGNQWLNKTQYELYKKYAKDVKEGKVVPNSDARIMELFNQQLRTMDVHNIEYLNPKDKDDKIDNGKF
jgi:Ca2+/Na+ antiporter